MPRPNLQVVDNELSERRAIEDAQEQQRQWRRSLQQPYRWCAEHVAEQQQVMFEATATIFREVQAELRAEIGEVREAVPDGDAIRAALEGQVAELRAALDERDRAHTQALAEQRRHYAEALAAAGRERVEQTAELRQQIAELRALIDERAPDPSSTDAQLARELAQQDLARIFG